VHDGKLIREFEKLYKELHIAGYYRGLLEDVDMVKAALKSAKAFIEKIIRKRANYTFEKVLFRRRRAFLI
jgi:cell division FtsZ-interacting protein ZapD